jgi:N-acetylglucosamine malate deacetylase 2
MVIPLLDARPGARLDAGDVAVVLAHPDDETIGCGALLSRLANVSVVCLTDGAPLDESFAKWAGFPDRLAYAARRRAELTAALATAGVGEPQITRFGLIDQEVGRRLAQTARDLAGFFHRSNIKTVLTHAFEGGHPDHDAAAFCTHAAARLMGSAGPQLVEMPFYHMGPAGMVTQQFCDGNAGHILALTPQEQALKRRMMAAHATQAAVLADFGVTQESFRLAKPRNFRELPNGGRLVYSTFHCAFNGNEWQPQVEQALAELGLG